MTSTELLAKIKAEIERRITDNTFGAKLELIDILAWLDTLEPEKPMQEETDLEEEIAGMYQAIFGTDVINRKEMIYLDTFEAIAHHFYDLGCRRTAERADEIEYNRQREESRVLPGFEDEPKGIPGKDFVPVDWVETLEMYGKWKIVKLEEGGSSEIPNDLLDAQVEIVEKLIGENNNDGANAAHPFACEYVVELLQKAVSAGAKWQAEHTPLPEDTVLFNKGVEEGKRLMMEEAVEGRVSYFESRDVAVIYYDDPKGNTMCFFAPSSGLETGDKVRIIIVKED